nr:protein RMD5 homolog isoform X2 [Physcomitrium patens]|eukprot:XP_024376959.1 protein RMD5 homolog isoform X2 [Physcomitrella patens]
MQQQRDETRSSAIVFWDSLHQIGVSQKELNTTTSKYGKILDKSFNPDIAKAYRDVEFDSHLINQIIVQHFYRLGLFELGDCFAKESQESNAAAALKTHLYEMYQNLDQLQAKNLEPALNWARKNRQSLEAKGSSLEFQLHQLQFVHVLTTKGRGEALEYAKLNFLPFSAEYMSGIQRLMACLLWANRLEFSPYKDLLSSAHWDKVALEFTRQCCNLLGQPYESPLYVTLSAGSQALSSLLKFATVMSSKKQEWAALKQMPIEIPLDNSFQFHSVFACPVSREQSTADNPPMLMCCGHVLCKQSIQKLTKSNSRMFKCPYCPLETTANQCRQIYF